jgi:hypothetical protein
MAQADEAPMNSTATPAAHSHLAGRSIVCAQGASARTVAQPLGDFLASYLQRRHTPKVATEVAYNLV